MRHGWTGKDERLIDPAVLTRDQNTSVALEDISRDGTLLAYAVKEGGADENSLHVFNVKTKKSLEDELPSARYFGVQFAPDGKSFYYARNNKEGTLLFQHVLGTRPAHDPVIFGREFRGEPLGPIDLFGPRITDDGHYLVVQINRGVPAKRTDIVFRDLTKPGSTFEVLVWALDSRFSADYFRGTWYVESDYKAPKGKIMVADPGVLPDAWKTIVPEGEDVIDAWSLVGGKIYVNRLKDVKTETSVFTLDGKQTGTVSYEGIGSGSSIYGRTTDRYGFYSFESFIVPPTLYRIDTMTGKTEVFFQPKVPFDSSQFELKQVFFKSKDGTQRSHVHRRKERPEDGRNGAPAHDRLWRFSGKHHSLLEPGVCLVDAAGRLVCGA